MERKFSAQEVLQLAINLEDEGVAFYKEYAELAKDEKIKALMLQMSEDEKEHAKVFQGFYNNLNKSEDDTYLMSDEVQNYLSSFSESVAFAREQKKPETLKEAIAVAIETEQMTIDYYSSLLKYDDTELSEVLKRLIDEETKHRERLKKLLNEVD